MPFSNEEKQIIQFGLEQGKTKQEIEKAILRFRAGITISRLQEQQQTRIQETRQDISETGQSIGEQFQTQQEGIQEALQKGTVSGGFQAVGRAARGISRALGEGIVGLGKAILPQKAEEAVGRGVQAVGEAIVPIAQTQPIQGIIQRFNRLKETNPELAANIDASLGIGELALDVVGLGEGLPVAKRAAVTGLEETRSVLSRATINNIAERISRPLSGTFEKAQPVIREQAIRQMDRALNLNPSDIRRIKQPTKAGENPSEWLLKREFSGSQQKIADDLIEYSVTTKSAVDEGLDNIAIRLPKAETDSANKILQVLKETFEDVPGNEKLVEKINSLITQKDYSLSELRALQQLGDAELGIFKRAGGIKEGAAAQGLFNLRQDLKRLIENKASDNGFELVQALNKETQVSREISQAIRKRLEVSSKLPEFGFVDAMLGVGSFAALGDPLSAAGVVITKKLLQSATFRTFVANKFFTLSGAEKQALLTAFDQGNTSVLLNFLGRAAKEHQEL